MWGSHLNNKYSCWLVLIDLMRRWRNVKHKRCFIMLCIMYAALSYRKIIADLGWLISARQGSNPVLTDLFQDKLEQETSLQPGYRCIFQLQQTAPIIIRWLDGIASWALRWTLYDRIPPLVESLSNDSSAVFVYANFSSDVVSACGLGVSQPVWDSLCRRTSCLCLPVQTVSAPRFGA